jgi:hypothetical protein
MSLCTVHKLLQIQTPFLSFVLNIGTTFQAPKSVFRISAKGWGSGISRPECIAAIISSLKSFMGKFRFLKWQVIHNYMDSSHKFVNKATADTMKEKFDENNFQKYLNQPENVRKVLTEKAIELFSFDRNSPFGETKRIPAQLLKMSKRRTPISTIRV